MSTRIRPSWRTILLIVLLLVAGLDINRRFSVDASMDHFLPDEGERQLYRVSRRVIDSTLTKRMILTVGHTDTALSKEQKRETLLLVAAQLKQRISNIEGIGDVTSGPPEGLEEEFFKLYFPRRFAFFSLDPELDAPKLFSDPELKKRAAELKRQLYGPESVLLRQLGPQDPWLLFPEFLKKAQEGVLSLEVSQGQFFASNAGSAGNSGASSPGEFAVLFVELTVSALDSSAQGPLLDALKRTTDELHKEVPGAWFVESSGANRFAVATERGMKDDIERVFTLSTIGLVLLFFAFFRSLHRVLFLAVPIISGLVAASWVSLLVYGKLHALTLAFGGAMIGVAVDYPVHVLCHHDLSQSSVSGRDTIRKLGTSLALAAGTTIAGLLGLAWTAFPGIREIAVFSSTGVSSALLATIALGDLLPRSGAAPAASQTVSLFLERGLERLKTSRRLLFTVLGCAMLLMGFGVHSARFAPGLDSLAPLDAGLMAEDNRVRERIGEMDTGKLIISLGPTLEDALITNEAVARTLKKAHHAHLLEGYSSTAALLRSESLQQRSQKTVRGSARLSERTLHALEKQGFLRSGFPDLEKEIRGEPKTLDWNTLEKSRLGPLLEPLIFMTEGEMAVITPLKGVQDEGELKKRIESIPGAHFFSQRAMLDQAYTDLRARTTELLFVGFLFVFLIALFRYRHVARASAALLPALLAAGATIGVLALLGHELNLLHMLGLLLVCSMGVDYGIFLVDAPQGRLGPTLLSISLGALSTMLSFGALSLSSAPALQALGSSIMIGIVLSLLLAPIALLVITPPAMKKEDP